MADLSDAEIAALLRVCEAERIDVPAAIQPHGVLLAVSPVGRVTFASANAKSLLGVEAQQLLGADISTISGLDDQDFLERIWRSAVRPGARIPSAVKLAGGLAEMVAFLTGGDLVLELEPGAPSENGPGEDWFEQLPGALAQLQVAGTVETLTNSLAEIIRRLTDFDRVMVYRFDEDWHGTVIAESKLDDLEHYLGLRYPASDIPAQARALYAINWQRLIPDATYQPVPVLADSGRDAAKLDLSYSTLRSVSPIHLRYLANMGVRASMSVSLMVDGQLWGLVACHSYAGPLHATLRIRTATEFLGRTASLLIHSVERLIASRGELRVARTAAKVTEEFQAAGRKALSDGLLTGETTLLDLFDSSAAAVYLDGRLKVVGDAPSPNDLFAIARLLWPRDKRPTMAVESLEKLSVLARSDFDSEAVNASAAGVLGVPIPGTRDSWLMWTRAEVLREITWAGDPTISKEAVIGPAGLALSPRTSFARYTDLVRGTAPSWQRHEIDVAENLARLVGEALAHRSEQDSRLTAALQRAVLLDTVPEVAGFNAAVRYLPFAEDAVGGDFYDFVALPNGHVAVVAGDVAGHGLAVAGVTAELRHALRAYLIREQSAPRALARLNELAAWLLPTELATVVVVDVDLVAKSAKVASAGHLPPLLLRGGEAMYLEAESAPALGADARSVYTERSYSLDAGDRLFLFSDGLIEKRGEHLEVSLERLRDVAMTIATDLPLEAACDLIVSELWADSSGDDVMLVALEPASLS
jgi:chemotaxis family two-component system sensor kinase Cph1